MKEKGGSAPSWQALVDARKHLDEIWNGRNQFRGRCWGIKGNSNPLGGSHITIGDAGNCVTVFQDPQTGEIKIYEFTRTEGTPLGDKVRSILLEKGLF